jgi:hypothetical protein
VPDQVEFATKPALATTMITRVVDAGLLARWVTGDEVYGADPDLRAQLETLQLGYVPGIGSNRRVTVHGARGSVRMRVDQINAGLGAHCWSRYSTGAGVKGPRASTTGPSSLCSPTTAPGTAGCSSAATPTTVSWPTTARYDTTARQRVTDPRCAATS